MATSLASAPSTSARPARVGCKQPRVFTPPLRRLTPRTSLGFAAIEFAETVLGFELYPWQKWLLIHALELLTDGSLRFRTVVVLVARQNGKSTLSVVLSLFFMYVLNRDLVIGTAQDLDVAEEIWQSAVDIVEETPELDALKERVVMVNGKKSLELMTGERYKVKAANRRAGRGLSGDLVLLDELREHQSWDAWGAVTKTTMARSDAQVWALSNAGDAASLVLRYLRKMAHLALGDPDGLNGDEAPDAPAEYEGEDEGEDDTLGIFEWSAPPGCAISDRDGWAQANPALGFGISERTVASAARTDPEWVFRTEVLCQWFDGASDGPFPAGAWSGSEDKESVHVGAAGLCVDTSWDRTATYVGLAGWRADGLAHVEVIARRAGTSWVAEWLTSDARDAAIRGAPVAVQARGAPASSLLEDLRRAGVNVVEWGGGDLAAATGELYDRVRAAVGEGKARKGLRHRGQPVLDVAAATALTRPMGDAFVWDRKNSPSDVAPLIAVTGALWALQTSKAKKRTGKAAFV